MANLVVVFLTLLLATFPNSNGTLSGSVQNAETAELLPADKITIPMLIRTSSGKFTIVDIPPGQYSIFVSLEGYRPTVVRLGKAGVDYKMQYAKPRANTYR